MQGENLRIKLEEAAEEYLEIGYLKASLELMFKKRTIIILGFIGTLITSWIMMGIDGIIPDLIGWVPLILAIVLAFKNKKKKEKYTQKLNELKDECHQEYNIPRDYCHPDILNKFAGYIEKELAETLADCSKLYNEEIGRNELIAAQKEQAKALQKLNSKL